MLQYSYSQTVWTPLLATLNLNYISCDSPIELLDSILLCVSHQHQGLQTVAKLIFCAYVWHIWAERNRRIFKNQYNPASSVLHCIIQTLQSRLLYLGVSLPESVSCHQNLPPTSYTPARLIPIAYQGWSLSLYSTPHASIGIIWVANDQPIEGALQPAMNFYQRLL